MSSLTYNSTTHTLAASKPRQAQGVKGSDYFVARIKQADPELCTLEACEPCPAPPVIAAPPQHGGPLTFPQTVSVSCALIQCPPPGDTCRKDNSNLAFFFFNLF